MRGRYVSMNGNYVKAKKISSNIKYIKNCRMNDKKKRD